MKTIKFNRSSLTMGPIASLMTLGIKPAGYYELKLEGEEISVELPYFSDNTGQGMLLLHQVMPERAQAYIMATAEVKKIMESSQERKGIVDVITNLDFSDGFDMGSILPHILPLATGGGVKKSLTFLVNSVMSITGEPLSFSEDDFSPFTIMHSVINQDLIKDPKIASKLAGLFMPGKKKSGGGNRSGLPASRF